MQFHIWFLVTLYYKMWQILLQNVAAILLQNATKVYYKIFEVFYSKIRRFISKPQVLVSQSIQSEEPLLSNSGRSTVAF